MKQKPNDENSSVKQALLDLKAAGGNAEAISTLLGQISQDRGLLQDADELFKSHQYPEHSLDWFRLQGNIEFPRFLSPNAVTVLIAICQNMQTDNLLQVSYRDLIDITHITSLKAVQPAMRELVQNGCIVEVMKAVGRKPAVYMVNPEIATVGKKKPHLTYQFWKKVRESLLEYETPDPGDDAGTGKNKTTDWNEYPKSSIRDKWITLTKERTYSKGTEKWKEDARFLSYNKIKMLDAKKKPTAKEPTECSGIGTPSESTPQSGCGSRIIHFEQISQSKRERKDEPDAYLEDDDISRLPF